MTILTMRTRALLLLLGPATTLSAQGATPPPQASGYSLLAADPTATRTMFRNYVAELRDTLVGVQMVQTRISRARTTNQMSVFMSQARELIRQCVVGKDAIARMNQRIVTYSTPDARGEQALQAYRSALDTLHDELALCAHFDSLAVAAKPVDMEKIEHIAIAASESVDRYDVIRNALLKLLSIDLPIQGKIYHGGGLH